MEEEEEERWVKEQECSLDPNPVSPQCEEALSSTFSAELKPPVGAPR